jgi:hypothetical protein
MLARNVTLCLACIAPALLALAALPAAAGGGSPVGGSWELTLSCKGTAGGAPSRRKQTLFLPIQDGIGGDLQAGAGDTGALLGYVLYESARPERARLALVSCDLSTLSGLVIHAAGKVTPERARLQGTAIVLDSAGEQTEQCKAKLVRTNAMAAPVLLCN